MKEEIAKIENLPLYYYFLSEYKIEDIKGKYGVIKIDKYKTDTAFKRSYPKNISLILKKVDDIF